MTSAIFEALFNLFKKPATYGYPAVPNPVPKNYRGLINYNAEKCIFCNNCEKVCPPGAIRFTTELEEGKQTYHYNPYLCIYCGECVRACPEPGKEGALWQEETLPPPDVAADGVNEKWFPIEKESVESKEQWKVIKKQRKAEEAAAKARQEAENQPDNG